MKVMFNNVFINMCYGLIVRLNDRLFKCLYCGKCFRWKGNLKEYERGYIVDKFIVCDCCGKSYKNVVILRVYKCMYIRENLY